MSLELGHQIEAGQGRFEILAQAAANVILNSHSARQKPEPEPQRLVIALGCAGLQIN
jgi:hypothetical protein